jgi:hypothetical protein
MCGPHYSLPPLLAERAPPRLPTRLEDEIRCTQIGSPHPDQQHLVAIPADQRIIAGANDLQALEVGKTRSVKIEMVDAVLDSRLRHHERHRDPRPCRRRRYPRHCRRRSGRCHHDRRDDPRHGRQR